MTAYVSWRGLGLGNGATQTLTHLALTSEYNAEEIAVDALLEGYKAPLDLDRLDQGARPEIAPWATGNVSRESCGSAAMLFLALSRSRPHRA
jgi:hypothetical protein